MRSSDLVIASLALALATGCGVASGKAWVNQMPEDRPPSRPYVDEGWKEGAEENAVPKPDTITGEPPAAASGETLDVREFPDGVPRAVVTAEPADNVFRNTYYD